LATENTEKDLAIRKRFLTFLLPTFGLAQIGITEDSHARKIDAPANVDLILLGSLSQMFDTYSINARLIDVATGVVRHALKVDMAAHAEFPRKIDELALRIGDREMAIPAAEEPDLNGTYQVRGADYVGLVTIREAGEIYLTTWEIDNSQTGGAPQTYSGWGLLHGGVLSAYYHDAEEAGDFGISTYEVLLGGKQLRGLYCDLGTAGTYGKINFENGVKQ
jgi:hypothetical protein